MSRLARMQTHPGSVHASPASVRHMVRQGCQDRGGCSQRDIQPPRMNVVGLSIMPRDSLSHPWSFVLSAALSSRLCSPVETAVGRLPEQPSLLVRSGAARTMIGRPC
eukprot:3520894-Prymnesium_polylepis.1